MSAEGTTERAVRLNVKLASAADAHNSREVFSGTPGLKSIIQTFPEEEDEELSRMFVLEIEPSEVTTALKALNENPAVEYTEAAAKRKLIR